MGVGTGLPLRVALRPDQPAVGGQLLQQLVVCLPVDGQARLLAGHRAYR